MKHNFNKAVQNFLYGYRKANNGPVVFATLPVAKQVEITNGANALQPGCNLANLVAYLAQPVRFGATRTTKATKAVAAFGVAVESYFANLARYKGIKARLPRVYTVVKIARPKTYKATRKAFGLRAF